MAFVWKNARKVNPVEFGPDGHGWEISPDKLTIVWYTGENVPKCLSIEDEDLEEITDDEKNPGVSAVLMRSKTWRTLSKTDFDEGAVMLLICPPSQGREVG